MYKFSFSTQEWEELDTVSSIVPTPRISPLGTIVTPQVYDGYSRPTPLNLLWWLLVVGVDGEDFPEAVLWNSPGLRFRAGD